MKEIQVRSRLKNYNILFELEIWSKLKNIFAAEKAVFIVDANVLSLYQASFETHIPSAQVISFEARESHKNLQEVETVVNQLLKLKFRRHQRIVAIGGGITQDVIGFVASTLYRGVKWDFIPTTLLSQTDSCLGGKTSINVTNFKNMLGTFYPPENIYICTKFLKTLKTTDIYSGIGEMLKLQLIKNDCDIKEIALKVEGAIQDDHSMVKLIAENLRIKNNIVEQDEFDGGLRLLLNLGHCFGHALESCSNYGVPHGIAVTVGTLVAYRISVQRALIDHHMYQRIEKLLVPYIKVKIKPSWMDINHLIIAIKNDKKRQGSGLAFVLPTLSGSFQCFKDISETEVEQAVYFLKQNIKEIWSLDTSANTPLEAS